MIVVIAGTNRPNSKTEIVARYYFEKLKELATEEVKYYSLQDLPHAIFHAEMYEEEKQLGALTKIQDEIFIPATKWLVVAPEYNGSYPGIFKLFIDALSIRKYGETFKLKKMGLIGVASGRAGNLRGMDQLTNSMNYLGFNVFRHKLPLSQIGQITDDSNITDDNVKELLDTHALSFLQF